MLKLRVFTSKLTEIGKLFVKIEFIRQEGQMLPKICFSFSRYVDFFV